MREESVAGGSCRTGSGSPSTPGGDCRAVVHRPRSPGAPEPGYGGPGHPNVAVTAMQKSQATRGWAWFRTKVARWWPAAPRSPPPLPQGMYRRTVRGETRRPSFRSSSARSPLGGETTSGLDAHAPRGRHCPGQRAMTEPPSARLEGIPGASGGSRNVYRGAPVGPPHCSVVVAGPLAVNFAAISLSVAM